MEIRAKDAYRSANIFVEAMLDNKGLMADGRSVILAENSTLAKTKNKELKKAVATLVFMMSENVHQYNVDSTSIAGWSVQDKDVDAILKTHERLSKGILLALKSDKPLELRVNLVLEIICDHLPTPQPFKNDAEFKGEYIAIQELLEKQEMTTDEMLRSVAFWQRIQASKAMVERKHLSCPNWTEPVADEDRGKKTTEFADETLAKLIAKIKGAPAAEPAIPPANGEVSTQVESEATGGTPAEVEPAPVNVEQTLDGRVNIVYNPELGDSQARRYSDMNEVD